MLHSMPSALHRLPRAGRRAWRVIRSRAFSAAALAAVSAVIIVYISLNLNAVSLPGGDAGRVALTFSNAPYRASAEAAIPDEAAPLAAPSGSGPRVQVAVDGVSYLFNRSGTVADALAGLGIRVGEHDQVTPAPAEPLTDGLKIAVDRLDAREYTKTEIIPFETETLYTNTIAKDATYQRKTGENGEKTLLFREHYVNGELASTETVKETVTKAPVKASVLVGLPAGTAISKAPRDIALNGKNQPVSYTAKYTGRATAYSSDRGKAGTRTASGRKAQVGVVAVNPNLIPYGTELFICSEDGKYVYGYAIAGDTGGGMMAGTTLVDLFFDTYEECLRFGAKKLNVYVIGKAK